MKNTKIENIARVAGEIGQAPPSKRVPLSKKFLKLLSELPDERALNVRAVGIAESVQTDLRKLYGIQNQQRGAVRSVEEIGCAIAARKPGPESIVLC